MRRRSSTFAPRLLPGGTTPRMHCGWRFVDYAPLMLRFLERHSPLRFVPNGEPDPYAELPGGKRSRPQHLGRAAVGTDYSGDGRAGLRAGAPTLRYRLRYEELVDTSFLAHPRKWMLRFGPKLVWRLVTGQQTMGGALVVGLLKGCPRRGLQGVERVRPRSPCSGPAGRSRVWKSIAGPDP